MRLERAKIRGLCAAMGSAALICVISAGCASERTAAGIDGVDPGVEIAEQENDSAPDAGPAEAEDASPEREACPDGMVLVPGGNFPFGSRGTPTFVDTFCIDRTEVSAGAFNACVEAGECTGYEMWSQCGENLGPTSPHQCQEGFDDYPANWIDWFRAEAYCRFRGGFLPTEVQWEKAARGPEGREFPWGSRATCAHAQYERGPVFNTCLGQGVAGDALVPVDAYATVESPYGAINLAGNVREWIDFREDRSAPPAEGVSGRSKGGDFTLGEDYIRGFAVDTLLGPGITTRGHGFRCAAETIFAN